MSKETAKKLMAELKTNEEVKAKVAGIMDPEELLKIAIDSGYDVTMEEFIEAEKEYRRDKAAETDEKLSFDDLEDVAGGYETSPAGYEIGCCMDYYTVSDCKKRDIYCTSDYYTREFVADRTKNSSCSSYYDD